jgi:hypothetical protein
LSHSSKTITLNIFVHAENKLAAPLLGCKYYPVVSWFVRQHKKFVVHFAYGGRVAATLICNTGKTDHVEYRRWLPNDLDAFFSFYFLGQQETKAYSNKKKLIRLFKSI